MGRLKDKVAIVTGAASGLGRAIVILFANEGANVIATDINEEGGKQILEEIGNLKGQELNFIKHDVTSESEWGQLMKTTMEKHGRLDILVNCAGVFMDESVENLTLEKWRWVMSINLDSVFLGTKYAAENMKKYGGSIVNISSVGGIVGTANSSPYNASKGGVRLLTKAAAVEFATNGFNIRVNSVHPGVIKTPMTEPMINDPVGGPEMLKWQPMGRFGEPNDVAYGVLYLASDESKFVTGSELIIDGGWSAQ